MLIVFSAVGIDSQVSSLKIKPLPLRNCFSKLQNSGIFCERERRPIFERKVWSECKTAREKLCARGSRLRHFALHENVRKRLFCSLLFQLKYVYLSLRRTIMANSVSIIMKYLRSQHAKTRRQDLKQSARLFQLDISLYMPSQIKHSFCTVQLHCTCKLKEGSLRFRLKELQMLEKPMSTCT